MSVWKRQDNLNQTHFRIKNIHRKISHCYFSLRNEDQIDMSTSAWPTGELIISKCKLDVFTANSSPIMNIGLKEAGKICNIIETASVVINFQLSSLMFKDENLPGGKQHFLRLERVWESSVCLENKKDSRRKLYKLYHRWNEETSRFVLLLLTTSFTVCLLYFLQGRYDS